MESDRIRKLVWDLQDGHGSFEEVAMEVWKYQFQHVPAYQAYCRAVGGESLRNWTEAPLLPTDVFKESWPLTASSEIAEVFQTSGTTGTVRGIRAVPNMEDYQRSILQGWRSAGLNFDRKPLFLYPSPNEVPDSSLGWMFFFLRDQMGGGEFLVKSENFDLGPLYQHTEPLFLMGTDANFRKVMSMVAPIKLPQGSAILETGGDKKAKRNTSVSDFHRDLKDFFGVEEVWNEYGMTEIFSPAYANASEGPHHFPPWCRARVLDPETHAKADGPGYLAIYDLASWEGVSFLLTQDIAEQDGEGFRLLGRDPAAVPRGCSLRTGS